jgi:hypothetical protein
VLFSDLILRKMTEGSPRTDPRASDMAFPPKQRLFPSSANCFPAEPDPPPISRTKIAHWFDCELASPNGADS